MVPGKEIPLNGKGVNCKGLPGHSPDMLIQSQLSFDANLSSFSLAESPPGDLNNYLQRMVCSCAMSSNCVWLQILYCSCVNENTHFSLSLPLSLSLSLPLAIALAWKWQIASQVIKNKLGDQLFSLSLC